MGHELPGYGSGLDMRDITGISDGIAFARRIIEPLDVLLARQLAEEGSHELLYGTHILLLGPSRRVTRHGACMARTKVKATDICRLAPFFTMCMHRSLKYERRCMTVV